MNRIEAVHTAPTEAEIVQRAVDLIRAGKPVPRGTLQTAFKYTPYDELRRLGLPEATESAAYQAVAELVAEAATNGAAVMTVDLRVRDGALRDRVRSIATTEQARRPFALPRLPRFSARW